MLRNHSGHTSACCLLAAGTLLWMLAADSYPDYDGYTIYTTKGAAARPQPRWPDQDANMMQEVRRAVTAAVSPIQCQIASATLLVILRNKPLTHCWTCV